MCTDTPSACYDRSVYTFPVLANLGMCHDIVDSGCGIKVKYCGTDTVAFDSEKNYFFLSIEKGWYRIMTELDEDYLFPPEVVEVV